MFSLVEPSRSRAVSRLALAAALSAGIAGERVERFLRRELRIEASALGRAGEGAGAAAAGLLRVAAGDDGLEAARVHGVDGDVGAHRLIDRPA